MSERKDIEVLPPSRASSSQSSLHTGNSFEKYRKPGCGLILLYIVIAWGLEIFDHLPGVNFDTLGLRPREPMGLIGVFTMPWLHGGFMHLISNTLTFIVLGYLIVATERQRFYHTSFMIMLISGLGTWLIGRSGSVHIGASAIIYGYFGYLVTRAFLEKRLLWTILGVVLVVLYGGMLWGMLPTDSRMSWEGHLMGFVAGVWMARVNFKKQPRMNFSLK